VLHDDKKQHKASMKIFKEIDFEKKDCVSFNVF